MQSGLLIACIVMSLVTDQVLHASHSICRGDALLQMTTFGPSFVGRRLLDNASGGTSAPLAPSLHCLAIHRLVR